MQIISVPKRFQYLLNTQRMKPRFCSMDIKGLCLHLCPQLYPSLYFWLRFSHLAVLCPLGTQACSQLWAFALVLSVWSAAETTERPVLNSWLIEALLQSPSISLPSSWWLCFMMLSLSQMITFLEGDLCDHNFDLLTVVCLEYNTIGPNSGEKLEKMPHLTDTGLLTQPYRPHSSMSHIEQFRNKYFFFQEDASLHWGIQAEGELHFSPYLFCTMVGGDRSAWNMVDTQ